MTKAKGPPSSSLVPAQSSEFVLYQTEDGSTRIECRFENEAVWLSQALMAELFQKDVRTINEHLVNIFEEGELSREATIRKFRIVRLEGIRKVSREVEHYNLPAILAVGYRVRSHRGTQFRQWATARLSEYLVKGFVLDDERLKNPDQPFDYFEELTRRIQDIRTSERRFYQKITDIYATSIDYDPTQDLSIRFFQTVQNKVHWAITGQTAAEIVHERADAAKPNVGLTNWRGATIRKQDVVIAKNYLNAPELEALNNLVEQYLIFAQGQAMRRVPMHMVDWIRKLDAFLAVNERDILTHVGRVSHDLAVAKAEVEYEKFRVKQLAQPSTIDKEFDAMVDEIQKLPAKKHNPSKRRKKP